MSLHSHGLTGCEVAAALGGEVAAPNRVLAPGPNHKSSEDRSLSVLMDPDAPDGFRVHSFANNDIPECRDHVRDRLGLPPWERKPRRQEGRWPDPTAEYIYRDQEDAPYLKVVRFPNKAGGRKDIRQMRWNGREWEWGKSKGPKIPFGLPRLLASPHAPVLIVEGEKDAENLHRLGLVATTSSEGAGKWTADLNKWFAGRKAWILPDNDEAGRKHARQVAENLQGIAVEVRIVPLPRLPEKGDVSDWLKAGGDEEELLRLCEAAPVWAPESEVSASHVELEGAEDIEPVLESNYVVKRVIDEGAMSVAFGPPGSGKTFFVRDLTYHIAAGLPWRGHRARQAAIVYLAAEGGNGAKNHLAVLKATYGAKGVPFAIRRAGLDLLRSDADLDAVFAYAREVQARAPGLPLLVVVDTLSRVLAGGDENAAADMNVFIRNIDKIRERTGAHVLIVHHTGKDTARGARGHSLLLGATDTEIEVQSQDGVRTATVTKQRDNPAGEVFAFTLRSVVRGVDQDGDQ